MEKNELKAMSNFTQGTRAFMFEENTRVFTIVAADSSTVATVRLPDGSTTTRTYHAKSHARGLDGWAGRPVIINHGATGNFTVVGEVLNADIAPEGLVLSFRIDDDRMLELIKKNAYEGFSIGTQFNPDDPLSSNETQILSYVPYELSVIMYPERPACPKGVCDIISMMTSCNHQEDVTQNKEEVKTMENEKVETPAAAESAKTETNCGCKGEEKKVVDAISKVEHNVIVAAKDQRLEELEMKIKELEAEVEKQATIAKSFMDKEKSEKVAALSSLVEGLDLGVDLNELSVEELDRLTAIHKKYVAMSASAEETPTPTAEEQKKSVSKPWIDESYTPGGY